PWKDTAGRAEDRSWGYGYLRLRVQKKKPTANQFVFRIRTPTPRLDIRNLNNRIPASLRHWRDPASAQGEPVNVFEVAFDLAKVPTGEAVDLATEILLREARPELLETANLYVDVETGLLNYWLILPEGKQYASVDLFRHPVGKVSARERIVPA